jgi:predicted transcriptional regulator YheO
MNRKEALDFLSRTAKGIAEMFGGSCETLVHDMAVPNHPILAIYNGHVTGRKVGSTVDVLGSTRDLDSSLIGVDFVNHLATTPSGRQIKSSTFQMIGKDYKLALGINFDFTSLIETNRVFLDLMSVGADLQSAIWEAGEGVIDELFQECVSIIGRPLAAMNKRDRLRLISLLDEKKAFGYRKSVPFVSERLGVSRYTIYKYLAEASKARRRGKDR